MKYYDGVEIPKNNNKAFKAIFICLLLVVIAALSYMLYSSYNKSQSEITLLEKEIADLKAKNESLNTKYEFTEDKLESLKSKYESTAAQLELTDKTLVQYEALATKYKQEAELWKDKYIGADTDNPNLPTSFYTTEELVKAIRSNPTQYANKKVTVLGTFYAKEDEKGVFDLPSSVEISVSEFNSVGVKLRYYINQSGINTLFKTDSTSTVLRTGDYIKITGIVVVEFDELYLMACEYDMVRLREDR